jgi:CHAT domain
MSVRFAKGAGPLAQLVRRRQDLVTRRQGEDRRLLAAVGAAANGKATEAIRVAIVALDDEINSIDKRLAAEFPEYTNLSNPKPLSIAAIQALLKADEALVLFLDVPQFGRLREESLAWVVTSKEVRWRSIPLGTRALSDRVAALRCGLDSSSWDDAQGWPETTEPDKVRIREQRARRERCEQLLRVDAPADNNWPPFDPTQSAWDKQRCPEQPAAVRAAEARRNARDGVSLRAIDLAELRSQAPLPETADELCAVADALGALTRETDTVWLGERATERNLKALSRNGQLARHKVVHFATHGLLSGESEAILKARAEPALILTPPKDGTSAAELEEDDGLLTASEVTQLDLDADWVVLSACNTAAGDKGDAEALSGLARAFFYAKARALLVSHWYVSSDAAVKLTTKAFAALKADPKIGRAEALRRSMTQLITKGDPSEAHPAMWAPFVLVGEGAR